MNSEDFEWWSREAEREVEAYEQAMLEYMRGVAIREANERKLSESILKPCKN